MGPEGTNELPSRPKCTWDLRTTPLPTVLETKEVTHDQWSIGNYFTNLWQILTEIKITVNLRGNVLKPQIFGRTYDLFSGIPKYFIASPEEVSAILAEVNICDLVSVINVFNDFNDLLGIYCKTNGIH